MKKIALAKILLISLSLSSCMINRRSMRESNYQLWLNKSDVSYTEQREGVATQSKILGIDFQRLFARKFEYGGIGNLPGGGALQSNSSISSGSIITDNSGGEAITNIITSTIGINSVSVVEQFAINDLIVKNPGYDLIMFPQFEVKKKWYIVGSKTEVKVKARLAKITPDKL